MLTDAAATLRRLGDLAMAVFALNILAILTLLDGDPTEAETVAQEALELAQSIGTTAFATQSLIELGYSALARGDIGLARTRFADSARAYQRIQDREGVTLTLDGLAAIALAHGQPEAAAKAIGTADATRERIRVGVHPIVERSFRGPLVAAVQAAVGSDAFQIAHAAGSETGPDQAIDELLRLTAAPT